jgi:hypothetical protein
MHPADMKSKISKVSPFSQWGHFLFSSTANLSIRDDRRDGLSHSAPGNARSGFGNPNGWIKRILRALRLIRRENRVYLHLGAHKTGTTYCQTVFKINQDKLRKAGVMYWDLNYTRKNLTPYLVGLSRHNHSISPEDCKARIQSEISAPGLGKASRLVISDENLTGFIREIVLRNGYKRLVRRMRPIRQALGGDVTVFLTIRNYADLISSMYCEMITTKAYFPFEQIRECGFDTDLSWVNIYQDLVKVFGKENVVVFEFKSFFSQPDEFLSRLVGTGIDFEYPPKEIRASPSAKAIEFIGSESAARPQVPIRKIARKAKRKFPRDAANPPFDPWTPEERIRLNERYQKDLAVIPCWSPDGSRAAGGSSKTR